MKGVFNIMKTNTITRIIIAIMAVVILNSLTVSVFAETGTDVSSEAYSVKRGQKENKGNKKKNRKKKKKKTNQKLPLTKSMHCVKMNADG